MVFFYTDAKQIVERDIWQFLRRNRVGKFYLTWPELCWLRNDDGIFVCIVITLLISAGIL